VAVWVAEVKVAVVEGPETSIIVEVVSGDDEVLACFEYGDEDMEDNADEDMEDWLGSV